MFPHGEGNALCGFDHTGGLVAAATCPCLCSGAQGETASVKASLVRFLRILARGDGDQAARALGWNASVDPCGGDGKPRVVCDGSRRVSGIFIENLRGSLDINGTVDAALLCAAAPALRVVNLRWNGLRGELPASIAGSVGIVELSLAGNQLSGVLPASLSHLRNLRALDVSRNSFAGELPGGLSALNKIVAFVANDNRFCGGIPDFDLTKFVAFNVSSKQPHRPDPQEDWSLRRQQLLAQCRR